MTLASPAGTTMSAPLAQRDFSVFLKAAPDQAQEMDFAVEGMHCAGCMTRIEQALAKEPTLLSARVNLTGKRLRAVWPEGRAEPQRVMDVLEGLGFKAFPLQPAQNDDRESREFRRLLTCLGVAAFASMNIMLLSVSVWSGHATGLAAETRDMFHWVSALIALPTAAYAGRPFFESAIRALKARAVNMDVPISLGILLALGMSVIETMNSSEHAYFDGAVMLIFFLLIGRTLDQMMRRKTHDTAVNLAALRAMTAVKFVSPHETREVPVAAIDPGDLVLVRPGDRIAVDGVIEKGHSEIDQSLITGETRPATAAVGDVVHAGTLNLAGTLQVRVKSAGSGTLLDDIERLISNATSARSGYVTLADRAARLYAPFVHATALMTFLGWMAYGLAWQQALVIAITVLIITCPCALGLAIPAVQVVASGALFRRSILINSGDALERLATADTVVFDKTGTLTQPEASVLNAADIPPDLVRDAARLALSSRHPLARALAGLSASKEPFGAVSEIHGHGLETEFAGERLRLGSAVWCGAEPGAAAIAERFPDASLIAVRKGARVAVFAIAQAIRPDAAATIETLRASGLDVQMLSGDRDAPVRTVADQLLIETALAAATPAAKVEHLRALAADGHKVLMVGDGLNDAPALASAHVSMSPVTSSDLAQASADVVFLGKGLAPVADAVRLSRKAHRLMRENLWLAVVYNMIAVPIAIAGHATPLVAALAMSGSSIIVTLNALRARRA